MRQFGGVKLHLSLPDMYKMYADQYPVPSVENVSSYIHRKDKLIPRF